MLTCWSQSPAYALVTRLVEQMCTLMSADVYLDVSSLHVGHSSGISQLTTLHILNGFHCLAQYFILMYASTWCSNICRIC